MTLERALTCIKLSNKLSNLKNVFKCSIFVTFVSTHGLKNMKKINKIFQRVSKSQKRRKLLQLQQQLLPATSSVCSVDIMYGTVKIIVQTTDIIA
jgi:amino acid permease